MKDMNEYEKKLLQYIEKCKEEVEDGLDPYIRGLKIEGVNFE